MPVPLPTPTPSLSPSPPRADGDEGGTDITRTLYGLFAGEQCFDKSRNGTLPGVVGIEGGTDLARGDGPMLLVGVVEPETEEGGCAESLLEEGNA